MTATLGAFLRLSRLKFLIGGIAGGALGTAMAGLETGAVDWAAYGVAQLTMSAFHLMTHYANDYFDRDADALSTRTPFSGGSGTLVDGSLAPVIAIRAAAVCAVAGTLGAAGLLAARHPLAAALAIVIGALAWSYSGPPARLLATGFGEFDTALVVAVLVPLCAFAAQTGAIDTRTLVSTLPGAAAMFAMMLGVEFPDRAADAATGKRNLLVRFGAAATFAAGSRAAAAIYVGAAFAIAAGAPPVFGLAVGLTLPLAAGYVWALRRAATDPTAAAIPAGIGVALFFFVSVYGACAYAVAAVVQERTIPQRAAAFDGWSERGNG